LQDQWPGQVVSASTITVNASGKRMLLPPGWRASYDWLIHIFGRFLHAKLTTGIGPFSSLAAAVRQLGTDREAKRVSNSLRICCGA
jgi:hypothetical protein